MTNASPVDGAYDIEFFGALVTGYGESHSDRPKRTKFAGGLSRAERVSNVLVAAGLPTSYVDALDDTAWDPLLDDETELALSRTGRHVGTPIITFRPPDGLSFFGPVISRVPDDGDALRLWDAVITLASFPGFAELKRSLREVPALDFLGGRRDAPEQEDWSGGHRAGHLARDRANPATAD